MSRRTYDPEFKIEAIKLVTERGYSLQQAADSLGVSKSVIAKWKQQYSAMGDVNMAFPGKGGLNPVDADKRRLEKEVRDLRIEREILKKAMAYFANPRK